MNIDKELWDAICFLFDNPCSPKGSPTRDTLIKLKDYIYKCGECIATIMKHIGDQNFRKERRELYLVCLRAIKAVAPSTADALEEVYEELDHELASLED